MGVSPIPFTAIDRYAARHGIEGEEFDTLTRMIRAMDNAALEHWRDQQPETTSKQKVSSRPVSGELIDALFG